LGDTSGAARQESLHYHAARGLATRTDRRSRAGGGFMIKKMPSETEGYAKVIFTLPPSIWAETVHLVGEFNNWSKTANPMTWDRSSEVWSIALDLPAGREYRFRYLVNGTQWHNDWDADKYEPNVFGGDNSVVVL